MSRVQNEKGAGAARLEKDRSYFLKRQDTNCEHMFVELGELQCGKVMEARSTIYEQTKQPVDANTMAGGLVRRNWEVL